MKILVSMIKLISEVKNAFYKMFSIY